MFFIGTDVQGGPLIASIIMLIPVTRRFLISGVPRIRVILLSYTFILIWICSFFLILLGDGIAYTVLWEVTGFLGMVGTVFILFIAIYEILSAPGR